MVVHGREREDGSAFVQRQYTGKITSIRFKEVKKYGKVTLLLKVTRVLVVAMLVSREITCARLYSGRGMIDDKLSNESAALCAVKRQPGVHQLFTSLDRY